MKYWVLVPAVLILSLGVVYTVSAGPIDPPAGPVTSTGRFGPRIDVLSIPAAPPLGIRSITASGSYYLSGNLEGTSIRVFAPNVTIDLNGYTIDAGGERGISDGTGAGGSLVIRNGNIVNANEGIGVGVPGLEAVVIEDITIRSPSFTGINVNTNCRAIIRNCIVRDSTNGIGIRSVGQGLVLNCVSTGNLPFDIAADFSQVRGCVAGSILSAQSIDNYLIP